MKKIIILYLITCFHTGWMQRPDELQKISEFEKSRAEEKQRYIQTVMDSAVELMENEDYVEADKSFRYVLDNTKTVSSDLAYYFGQNSFHLKLYKQSIDWLTKYVQLKGTTGKHSDDAVMLLKKAEDLLKVEIEVKGKAATEILSRDFDIDCGPTGKVVCPVCSGTTVIIKKNYLSDTYRTCPYCNKHGFLTCEDYNKLVRGQLKAED